MFKGNKEIVSVIIITKNEDQNIEDCLLSLLPEKNSYIYEVILVDSNSDDKTREIAGKYKEKLNLQILNIKESTHYNAGLSRSIGANAACGNLILFLDGDMVLKPEFLKKTIPLIDEKEVYGIIGLREDKVYSNGILIKTKKNTYGITHLRQAFHFGGALLISKEAYLSVNGYKTNLYANEEPELYIRLKKYQYKILETPVPMITHHDTYIDKISKVKSLFSKRSISIGQVVRTSLQEKTLLELLKHRFLSRNAIPIIFDFISLILLILAVFNVNFVFFVMIIQISMFIFLMMNNNLKNFIISKLLVIQSMVGFFVNKPVYYRVEVDDHNQFPHTP
ncbi:glycosyltransferase family 2 protein [Salicibibacter halophilus]|uniref:Glycosyltransferase family 2 protein n=1 Tax=Salicibibacter halophilus TaxID=2502791 RepID=A0A514LF40_9BACI|nr:glycosyltransferase family A protein [Salicibibacter halophilus]QDI90459.1 glycosyltransferase family 2 protein [Salicibibacter halophilus]